MSTVSGKAGWTVERREKQRQRMASIGRQNKGKPMHQDQKHWAWKGDKVGYGGLHNWIRRRLGTPNICSMCGTTEAKAYDWSNISGEYKRDLSDWQRLCRACHQKYDDVKRRSWITRKAKKNV